MKNRNFLLLLQGLISLKLRFPIDYQKYLTDYEPIIAVMKVDFRHHRLDR